ncbi:hypothetical protein [Aestuariivita boseongensis]|uniref:hypothetical protein n=1 Tax=Aestuariivita boseongensis TaxID=1470562 RepID=UPI000682D28B|nr:hypothetical protein [Aestuariivita boseongensis]
MIRRALALIGWCLLAPLATADPQPIPPAQPDRPVPMFINLSTLADWGTQQPFIDRMKAARPWIGHLPGRWGGMTDTDLHALGLLDAQGWPTRIPGELGSIGTLIMTDLPEEAMTLSGRYLLRFEGDGIVEVSGRAQNVRYGPGRISFDFTPGPGGVDIRIQRTDRQGTGDYLRNITVMRKDRAALYDQGAVFNPDFLAVLRGFDGLRFMNWMQTNNSTLTAWEDRPRPDDYSFTWRGVPMEMILDLSARIGADTWLTLPHQADDGFFRNTATMVKDRLPTDTRVFVEYSNEVWNWGFAQAAWADAQAKVRWGQDNQWMQFYGMRAAQMAQIWRDVFADRPDQLVTVLSTQADWLGLEDQALYAPLWQAETPGNPAPYTLFDAYAITGYLQAGLGEEPKLPLLRQWLAESRARAEAAAAEQGLTGAAYDAYVTRRAYDHATALAASELYDGSISGAPRGSIADLKTRVFPYHGDVARAHGLELIMYEGGTHVVGVGALVEDEALDAFFRHLNYSTEMGALYAHLIAGWSAVTDGPFNVYNDVSRLSKWGSWGALRHLGDDNPRWDTILRFREGVAD